MSSYYNIDGKKLRVSDHEPNTKANGSNDIYFWTTDACGNILSIGGQIDAYCDKHGVDISVFEKVINDFSVVDEECSYMLMEIESNKAF